MRTGLLLHGLTFLLILARVGLLAYLLFTPVGEWSFYALFLFCSLSLMDRAAKGAWHDRD